MQLWKGVSLTDKKNILILGEAGSGKTELAIAAALWLREQGQIPVTVFDMDQTKPLYRLRNVSHTLEAEDVRVMHGDNLMDSPVVPTGVEAALTDPGQRVVLDAGGNRIGALCLGQYRELLKEDSTQVFYIINPYRGFSGSGEAIARTMEEILSCGEWGSVQMVCNPYCGGPGEAKTVLAGAERLTRLLEPLGRQWEAIMLPETLWDDMSPLWKQAIRIQPRMPQVLDL